MSKWYKVKAKDTNINKPKGHIITFHIGGKSEDHVRHAIAFKGYVLSLIHISEPTRPY